jgi:acetoacetyl-CoA reductase
MTRVALVTGGTRGIGRATREALRDAGYDVASNYAGNDEAAQKFAAEMGLKSYKFDVADYDACQTGINQIMLEKGPVDILVNNAGITWHGTLIRMSRQQWDEVIDTNLRSCFNMARATFPAMREREYERVINIGSINGQASQYGQVDYAAAKSGIHGFTKALDQECARYNITVNAIAAGYVDMDMIAALPANVLRKIVAKVPVGRLGHAHEIARGVMFFVADDATFVTGSNKSINGGQHMY